MYWGKKKNKSGKTDTKKSEMQASTPRVEKQQSKVQSSERQGPPSQQQKLKKEYSTQIPLEFASEVNLNENESDFTTYIVQTRALIWKNYLLFSRKMRIILFMVLAPMAVGFMLNVIIDIGKVLHNSGVLDFPVEQIGLVPYCNPGYYFNHRTEEPCLSVGYSIIGESKDLNAK